MYKFPEALGLSRIIEHRPDVFAVLAGTFSFSTGDPGFGDLGCLAHRPQRCQPHLR